MTDVDYISKTIINLIDNKSWKKNLCLKKGL
jgi:hypothetical protein